MILQSTEFTIGPPDLVQHFCRGRSHRRKSAACPKFHMIWLYRSSTPVGRRGVISLVQMIFTCPRNVKRKGEGVGTLCLIPIAATR